MLEDYTFVSQRSEAKNMADFDAISIATLPKFQSSYH
jgi:hypothetical protein